MLQSSAKIRHPSWFNRTINYKRASEARVPNPNAGAHAYA